MRVIGARMVDTGAFDEVEDFGFVTKDEYNELFENPDSMLTTIRSRREEY